MSNEEDHIKEIVGNALPGKAEISVKRPRRVFIKVQRADLKILMKTLSKDLKVQHLSTITARDTGTDLEVLYHFFTKGTLVTVRTSCPRDDPTIDSIVSIFPSAILYERELKDMLGIEPKGHPDLRRLVLPDDWNQGYPLRKDWKPSGGESVDQS
jgi:NADH:ubiquinone oxidoreductase subunit C